MIDEAGRDTRVVVARPAATTPFAGGASMGCGTLPHRDAVAAAAFAIGEFDIPTIPLLPNLRGSISSIVQAIADLPGTTVHDGRLHADADLLAHEAVAGADLNDASFAGMRAFVRLADTIRLDGMPVAWHVVGPVTLGVALHEAGLDVDTAFARALHVVRGHLAEIAAAVADVLPRSPQLAMLDEPALADLMDPAFPVPPDQAVDLVSSGMATLASDALVGVHCDRPCDLATMLATGPGVISVPVDLGVVEWAGYLDRFLDDGGVVAWGVVPTDCPVAFVADRYWRTLSDLWCELVRHGCDPVALRRQAMVTPGGGLDRHSASTARRIARMTEDVAKRVQDQANATRFSLGA